MVLILSALLKQRISIGDTDPYLFIIRRGACTATDEEQHYNRSVGNLRSLIDRRPCHQKRGAEERYF